jgi:hypothetical protein
MIAQEGRYAALWRAQFAKSAFDVRPPVEPLLRANGHAHNGDWKHESHARI